MMDERKKDLENLLLKNVPKDGRRIGNVTLLAKFKDEATKKLSLDVPDDHYWDIRNGLIAVGTLGKGRGKGGSVYRVHPSDQQKSSKSKKRPRESELYPHFDEYVRSTWTKDNEIKDYVFEKTASQGKRKTGGTWTRPDFALVSVRSYPFIPGKVLDLITFEIKPADDFRIEGVFETAAHTRFSNKSYLVVHTPQEQPETEEFSRLEKECERFNVGLIVFANPEDPSTYETLQEPMRRTPDPEDVNGFVATQLGKQSQTRILEMLK